MASARKATFPPRAYFLGVVALLAYAMLHRRLLKENTNGSADVGLVVILMAVLEAVTEANLLVIGMRNRMCMGPITVSRARQQQKMTN